MLCLQRLSCEASGCLQCAFGEDAVCPECLTAFCRTHYDAESHSCRYITKLRPLHFDTCLSDLDGEAIVKRAEALRPGHGCTVKIPATRRDLDPSLMGGFNILVRLEFDDGVGWLARIARYSKGDGPEDMLGQSTESEVATYHKLQDHGFPVPRVMDWGIGVLSKTKNRLCRHIIYELVEGENCADMTGGISDDSSTPEGMRPFIDGYAALSIKLSEIPCEALGSFTFAANGDLQIGPPVSTGYPESLEAPYFKGPFLTLRDRYTSRIDGLIGMILKGIAFRHAPLLHYLALLEARDLVESHKMFSRKEEKFYIRHPDASGSNIMAKEGKITGLIDWEWTSTTTKEAAFASPKWAYDTDAYLEGENAQTPEEILLREAYEKLGRKDLANCVRNGRIFHRLDDITGHWMTTFGDEEILGALNGLTKAFRGDGSQSMTSVDQWIQWAKDKHYQAESFDIVLALNEEMQRTRRPAFSQRAE